MALVFEPSRSMPRLETVYPASTLATSSANTTVRDLIISIPSFHLLRKVGMLRHAMSVALLEKLFNKLYGFGVVAFAQRFNCSFLQPERRVALDYFYKLSQRALVFHIAERFDYLSSHLIIALCVVQLREGVCGLLIFLFCDMRDGYFANFDVGSRTGEFHNLCPRVRIVDLREGRDYVFAKIFVFLRLE